MLYAYRQAGAESIVAIEQTMRMNFIKALRTEQDTLRNYLASFDAGATVHRNRVDWTATEIATVKREIASLQVTIDRVVTEQGIANG